MFLARNLQYKTGKKLTESYLKLVSAIFYQIVIFHQMIALQKL